MKNIFVIGAHGRVGQILVRKLSVNGYNVFAGFRNEDQFDTFADLVSVKPVKFELSYSVGQMADIFSENLVDTVIFAAGSSSDANDETILRTDLDGAVKSIDATDFSGAGRYIMIGSTIAHHRETWDKYDRAIFSMAKLYSERILEQSRLNYTVVIPAKLSDDSETHQVAINNDNLGKTISRADVANFIVAIIDQAIAVRNIYAIASGNQTISNLFN